jgi:iron complex transport system ATP-binding protein
MLIVKELELEGRLTPTSLTLPTGSLLALFGNNGAGKSTLLKLLAGLWKPTKGSVFWKGEDLAKLERFKRSQILTYIPQNGLPSFPYSVEDFIDMGTYYSNGSIVEALESCNLLTLRKRSILAISQGERQRAYIARGIASGAQLFLFDEPTAHLDKDNSRIVWDLIKNLSIGGKTVIVATHEQEKITPMASFFLSLS